MTPPRLLAISLALLSTLFCAAAFAQPLAPQGLAPRRPILFETAQTTSVGQSIYILGDLPELGGNDMTRAVKLEPAAYPLWRVTISLPAGVSTTYRFVRRSDGPGQTSQPANGTFLTSPTTLNVEPLPNPVPSKVLVATWNIARPLLWHRPANTAQPFTSRAMSELGPAVAGRANETQWLAWTFAPAAPGSVFFAARQHHPHWRATAKKGADEFELEPSRLDGLHLAFALPPGAEAIELRFEPWVRWAWLSPLVVASAAALLVARQLLRRRNSTLGGSPLIGTDS